MSGPKVPEIVHVLERLQTMCTDGVEGYRIAASRVKQPQLHAALERNRVERDEMVAVIINMLVEFRKKHSHHGSVAGALHRGLVNALGVAHADDIVVHECKRGDEATLAVFDEALRCELEAEDRERIERLRAHLAAALERLAASAK